MSVDLQDVAIILQPFQQVLDDGENKKYGGVERVVSLLVKGLEKKGIDVTLYAGKESDLPCTVEYPAGIFDVEFGKKSLTSTELAYYAGSIYKNIKDLEKKKEGFDIINNHYDPLAFIALQGIETPVLTTLHGPATEENKKAFGCFPSSAFSAVSSYQMNAYPPDMNFLGFVYNGISEKHPFSDEKCDYLFSVSRIRPSKGQRTSIKIAKKAGLDIIIAGNVISEPYFKKEISPYVDMDLTKRNKQEERRKFIEEISDYEPEGKKVIYLGEVTGRERDQIMQYSKALLFPIEKNECFGLVLIEAGITGTPVIAFNKCAIPEIVENGKTGFYGNSIDELVEYTKRVDEIDPRYCREYIKKKFSADKMVDGYIKLYEKVINLKQSGH